jgi:septal ring factor EnvC (AmiA/AmiB activator)
VNLVVALFAVLALSAISMAVGTSLDTEGQRRTLRDIAEERRDLNAARIQVLEEQRSIVYERRKLAEDQSKLERAIQDHGRCSSCSRPPAARPRSSAPEPGDPQGV